VNIGLQPSDVDFAKWLKDIKKTELKGTNIKELKEEYNDSKNSLELNNSRFKLCPECKQPNTGIN
jgi:transposase